MGYTLCNLANHYFEELFLYIYISRMLERLYFKQLFLLLLVYDLKMCKFEKVPKKKRKKFLVWLEVKFNILFQNNLGAPSNNFHYSNHV